ncbi:MAG: hypothetical protein ABI862_18145, partial [Ilumatobacteraceae bacterium]
MERYESALIVVGIGPSTATEGRVVGPSALSSPDDNTTTATIAMTAAAAPAPTAIGHRLGFDGRADGLGRAVLGGAVPGCGALGGGRL